MPLRRLFFTRTDLCLHGGPHVHTNRKAGSVNTHNHCTQSAGAPGNQTLTPTHSNQFDSHWFCTSALLQTGRCGSCLRAFVHPIIQCDKHILLCLSVASPSPAARHPAPPRMILCKQADNCSLADGFELRWGPRLVFPWQHVDDSTCEQPYY